MTSPAPTASHITTHVLDTARGRPASGLGVRLEACRDETWELVGAQITDDDGRCGELGPAVLDPGRYRLSFDSGSYFADQDVMTFYPEIVVVFAILDAEQHYHVPVLLSPFSYSTYRGS